MKTKYILIALTLLLSTALQAQSEAASENNGFMDGLVNTLDNFKDDALEAVEDVVGNVTMDDVKDAFKKIGFWEKFMQGDIRLIMKKHDDFYLTGVSTSKQGDMFGYREFSIDASLSVEFDWDNRALKMVGKGERFVEMGNIGYLGGADIEKHFEDNIVQYTDKDGYWYVPVKFEGQAFANEGLSGEKYVRFNAKQMAIDNLNDILDLSIDLMTDKLTSELIGLTSVIDFTNPEILIAGDGVLGLLVMSLKNKEYAKELWNNAENLGDEKHLEFQKDVEETINALLSKELEKIGGFPVFIHWAFLYSPEVISAKYGNKVEKTSFNCEGVPKGCLKFTIKSGPDKGKSMAFDRQGRLKHINALKEGTATYYYDQDITVKIPEALDLGWYFGNKKRNQELYEEVTKKRNKQRYEKELKILKEELKSATSEEERKEIKDRIEEMEKRLKNESN